MNKLLDELAGLMPILQCSIGGTKSVADLTSFSHLILNDAFDYIRNQILVVDPLPSAIKAINDFEG